MSLGSGDYVLQKVKQLIVLDDIIAWRYYGGTDDPIFCRR